jgi:glutaredoxin
MSSLNITTPHDDIVTVYTKSNCKWCDKVKEVLNKNSIPCRIINCDLYLKNKKAEFLNFIAVIAKREYKTFPMVFNGLEFIGGHDDTILFIQNSDKNNINFNSDF